MHDIMVMLIDSGPVMSYGSQLPTGLYCVEDTFVIEELSRLLAVNGYLPHGYCISWSPPLVVTYVVSDILIFISYFSMPVALGYFAHRRKDFPYQWLLWMFAAFIMACGSTHLMSAIVLWKPLYGLDALLKAVTAIVSVVTAIVLWPLIPHALKLPSPAQLRRVNAELQSEVAERRQVEEALRKTQDTLEETVRARTAELTASEEKYRSLVTAMAEGICVQTADGAVVAVNPAAERIQGRSSEQMLGRTGVDPQWGAIYEDGRPFPGELHPAMVTLRTGEPQKDVVMGIHRPDGTLAWISINSQPLIADGESVPYAVVTTFHDITEKRRNDEELAAYRNRYRQHLLEIVEHRTDELRSSELRYAFLFQNMQEGVAHCRVIFADDVPVDYEFIEVNPAFDEVTGLREAVGRRISEMVPDYARDSARCLEIIAQVVRTGEPARWEEDLASRNRWFSLAAYRPAPGEFVLVIDNITERKRAMADLQASENRLRLAKSAAGLGIFDWNIVSGMGQLDEQASAFLGIALGEPITCDELIEAVHPGDRANVQARINRAYDPLGSGEYHAEYRVLSRADGSVRQVEANGQTFFEGGCAVRFLGTVKDVSERKRLEDEVQEQRAEMEVLAKQQVAAQTAAAIAHELNQPMVSICAYGEAALRMLQGGNKKPEKLTHALEGAMQQAQRAGRTLHELLDFLHKGEVLTEPVDLNRVVREALGIARESGYGNFTPVVELEPALPPVLANRLQLQKVLVNLLHNGVEAMRSVGVPAAAITITVRTVAERNVAQVTVQDTGPGLDAETVHRIFEPFFTTKPSGIGLGLAISRALIEAHGGQLWADLETGSGATFHFTVPFAA
jgi:PAS domain S-box-containing protein